MDIEMHLDDRDVTPECHYFVEYLQPLLKEVAPNAAQVEIVDLVKLALVIMFNPSEDIEYAVEYDCDFTEELVGAVTNGLLHTMIENLPDYKWIEGYTGDEGGGENCHAIIRFNGKFYQATWKYYSTDGCSYYPYYGCSYYPLPDTLHEVFPKQKMITVYDTQP